MIGRGRMGMLIAAATMGLVAPIARHYEHDDAPEPEPTPQKAQGGRPHGLDGHNQKKRVEYFNSGKPMSKRRKRRLRGRARL